MGGNCPAGLNVILERAKGIVSDFVVEVTVLFLDEGPVHCRVDAFDPKENLFEAVIDHRHEAIMMIQTFQIRPRNPSVRSFSTWKCLRWGNDRGSDPIFLWKAMSQNEGTYQIESRFCSFFRCVSNNVRICEFEK